MAALCGFEVPLVSVTLPATETDRSKMAEGGKRRGAEGMGERRGEGERESPRRCLTHGLDQGTSDHFCAFFFFFVSQGRVRTNGVKAKGTVGKGVSGLVVVVDSRGGVEMRVSSNFKIQFSY